MKDEFFSKRECDRCSKPLHVRTMSWFTTEVICMDCSNKEKEIKSKLRAAGLSDMEGCGYIPQIKESQ